MMERPLKRKPNWTDAEHNTLLDLYGKFKDVLASKDNSTATCHEKTLCWLEITKQINQLNPRLQRSVEEVKRKWHNLLGQGRRDYFDLKNSQHDPSMPQFTMPAVSRRTLELYGIFTGTSGTLLNQDSEEFIFLDASSTDVSSDVEYVDTPDVNRAQDGVKQECRSPGMFLDSSRIESSPDLEVVNVTPQQLSKSVPTTTLRIDAHTQQLHPVTLNAVMTGHSSNNATSSITRITPMDSPNIIYSPHFAASTSNNSSDTATTNYSAPSTILNSSPRVIGPSSLHNRPGSFLHPLEPSRKKPRASDSSEQPETRSDPHAEREAELRVDILQLEKEKLWLETEKLRLEIDILRKQKQQMGDSY